MDKKRVHEILLYFPPYYLVILIGLIFIAALCDDAECEADLYFDPRNRPHHGLK